MKARYPIQILPGAGDSGWRIRVPTLVSYKSATIEIFVRRAIDGFRGMFPIDVDEVVVGVVLHASGGAEHYLREARWPVVLIGERIAEGERPGLQLSSAYGVFA